MNGNINPLALGYAGAVVGALMMLVLGILGNLGVYMGAVSMMQQWHVFFSLSIGGIIAGIIEAAVVSFVFLYVLGWVYSRVD